MTDALFRLNQANPKDPSCEKENIVRFVAQESTLVTRERLKESLRMTHARIGNCRGSVHPHRRLIIVQHSGYEEWSVYHRKTSAAGRLDWCDWSHCAVKKSDLKDTRALARQKVEGELWWPKMDAERTNMQRLPWVTGCDPLNEWRGPSHLHDLAADVMGPIPRGDNFLFT